MTHNVHHVNIIDLHKAIVKKYKVMAEGLQPQPISLMHSTAVFAIFFPICITPGTSRITGALFSKC